MPAETRVSPHGADACHRIPGQIGVILELGPEYRQARSILEAYDLFELVADLDRDRLELAPPLDVPRHGMGPPSAGADDPREGEESHERYGRGRSEIEEEAEKGSCRQNGFAHRDYDAAARAIKTEIPGEPVFHAIRTNPFLGLGSSLLCLLFERPPSKATGVDSGEERKPGERQAANTKSRSKKTRIRAFRSAANTARYETGI